MPLSLSLTLRVAALCLFAVAAHSDLKSRSAPNWVWIAVLSLSSAALVFDPGPLPLASVALVAFVFSLSLVGFARDLLGGADAKALALVPLTFPRVPGTVPAETHFTAFNQGFLALVWVSTGSAFAAFLWTRRHPDADGIPFLFPLWIGLASLFVAGGVTVT